MSTKSIFLLKPTNWIYRVEFSYRHGSSYQAYGDQILGGGNEFHRIDFPIGSQFKVAAHSQHR